MLEIPPQIIQRTAEETMPSLRDGLNSIFAPFTDDPSMSLHATKETIRDGYQQGAFPAQNQNNNDDPNQPRQHHLYPFPKHLQPARPENTSLYLSA